jgi:hypothetical protein
VDAQPAGVLDVDVTQFSEDPVPDQAGGVAHHGVGGVAVGDGQHLVVCGSQLHQLGSAGRIGDQRLLAGDRDAGLEEGRDDLDVAVVRSRDHHEVHAVGTGGLGRRHGPVVGVGAVGVDAQLRAHRCRSLGVVVEAASDEAVSVVEQ